MARCGGDTNRRVEVGFVSLVGGKLLGAASERPIIAKLIRNFNAGSLRCAGFNIPAIGKGRSAL